MTDQHSPGPDAIERAILEDLSVFAAVPAPRDRRSRPPRLLSLACACVMILGTQFGIAAAWHDKNPRDEGLEQAIRHLDSTSRDIQCQALVIARRRILDAVQALEDFRRTDLSLSEQTTEALHDIEAAARGEGRTRR